MSNRFLAKVVLLQSIILVVSPNESDQILPLRSFFDPPAKNSNQPSKTDDVLLDGKSKLSWANVGVPNSALARASELTWQIRRPSPISDRKKNQLRPSHHDNPAGSLPAVSALFARPPESLRRFLGEFQAKICGANAVEAVRVASVRADVLFIQAVRIAAASPRSSYALFHRIAPSPALQSSPSTLSQSQWQKRAVLEVAKTDAILGIASPFNQVSQLTASSFTKDPAPLKIPSASLESLEYQLTLLPQDSQELPGESGRPDTGLAIASAPLCAFLLGSSKGEKSKEYLNIWVRPITADSNQNNSTFAHNIQLDLLGIQWASTASCMVHQKPKKFSESDQREIRKNLQELNTWSTRVLVRQPEILIEPILRPYPVNNIPEYLPDGSVKPPPTEKGWFAKYWMYILPAVALLMLGGGAPPDEGDQGSNSQN
ncbi:hypothetical protein O181_028970 [Austropuccinia psidii MF-1]|uniref:ER membrane protein complex subunit 10 n=1 Tax=Austropuccinia psidii MF-1 TaxID=1389203 RepID=A0A9Q3CTP9_9BASI|nr:hypothetical protein [Austropuccinia psidii MF-1]